MKKGLIGRKLGMTRIYNEAGEMMPVTVIEAGPCTVLQIRTAETDGYDALQLGFEDARPHRSTKPLIGHAAAAGTGPKRVLREVRQDGPTDHAVGDVLTVGLFEEGQIKHVDVTGVSKGRGFSGVMRRHGFGGQRASHGVERKHRSPGSIGGSAPLGRGRSVRKGKRMPGQFGNVRCTARNQILVSVDAEKNLLVIRGSVPGHNGGLVLVRESVIG
ncbi:MAG TPA: 50S ribosomal protein L3 [Phycisphaerae bacterium]|nr:50S ribosomal protein L3 [Phycisphaerae bacterium]